MDELQFKVSAELKNILGKDLITSDNIAVFELVKNSYDAHATKVEITFGNDEIVIADNGKGMSKADLINKWLFVGYSAKRDGTEDASYRNKIKRNFAGAKGIGRLSCDRLSEHLVLTTKNGDSPTVETLEIDWNNFENRQDKEFDKISVQHNSSSSPYNFPLNSSTGTVLKFNKLNRIWNAEEILNLRKSLEKLINPFSSNDNFSIEIIAPKFNSYENNLKIKIADAKARYEELTPSQKQDLASLENSFINGIIKNSIIGVLDLKTTQIESKITNGIIKTKLSDRGVLMYEIEEPNKFSCLEDVSINLYYLNRAAKYNFSLHMGVQPVNYGNVFLFRNGFRIWPYGEFGDDSWGLNQRVQQGYNRFLGTRDLFGRVDVETERVDDFKEVSSRDGGLIKNESVSQLMEYFTLIHHRLERYVVGVLWGEGFIRNEYFKSKELALKARHEIQHDDKDSDNTANVLKNIGSKVDFLQLIKSLVNDNSIRVKSYNTNLANIVSDTSSSITLQKNMIEDLRRIIEKTKNSTLALNLFRFEKQILEIKRQKNEAEQRVEEAENAKRKAEKERDAQIQKNKYLSSARNTSREVEDLMHTVLISSTDLQSLVNRQKILLKEDVLDRKELEEITKGLEFDVERIHVLSSLITQADTSLLREAKDIDVFEYTKEFMGFLKRSIKIDFSNKCIKNPIKKIPILELSIILQNLISNAKKAQAEEILITFWDKDQTLYIDFSDNGNGVDLEKFTKDTIFEVGVTNRKGGSGIGLSTIREEMRLDLNGEILFVDNGLYQRKGATFRLIFK